MEANLQSTKACILRSLPSLVSLPSPGFKGIFFGTCASDRLHQKHPGSPRKSKISVHIHITSTIKTKHSITPGKVPLYLIAGSSSTPGPHLLPLQISFSFSRLSYKWNSTMRLLSCLATFAQHDALEIHLCCGLSQHSPPFPGCVVLHRTNIPPFTSPSNR